MMQFALTSKQYACFVVMVSPLNVQQRVLFEPLLPSTLTLDTFGLFEYRGIGILTGVFGCMIPWPPKQNKQKWADFQPKGAFRDTAINIISLNY